jgi:hypothetical protein
LHYLIKDPLQLAAQSILKTLAYFNVFNYPLKKEEIISYLDASFSDTEMDKAFRVLLNEKLIFRVDEFYALYNNPFLVQRRKKGNERAIKQLRIAAKVARLLSRFPYVRGVFVSGSLSKNFADDGSDIDFFIITAKNRLWIARTIMHLFKKLTYLTGKQHWFCMNYFVDETALEIREKNIFTATEVITALPLRGDSIFRDFITANEWTKKYYPHHSGMNRPGKIRKGFIKPVIEMIFNNKLGNGLDNWLMQLTIKRWRKKTELKKRNSQGILMAMDAGKHYSKSDPRYFQEKVVHRFNLKMEQLLQESASFTAVKAV